MSALNKLNSLFGASIASYTVGGSTYVNLHEIWRHLILLGVTDHFMTGREMVFHPKAMGLYRFSGRLPEGAVPIVWAKDPSLMKEKPIIGDEATHQELEIRPRANNCLLPVDVVSIKKYMWIRATWVLDIVQYLKKAEELAAAA